MAEPRLELSPIQGASVKGFIVQLEEVGSNRWGARYFKLYLENQEGLRGEPWVVMGLFHQGTLLAYNWIETMAFNDRLSFGDKAVSFRLQGEMKRLLGLLVGLIPPGGHIMVEYESPLWQTTRAGLALGWPPLLTPLRGLLWEAGCRGGFKDFHFAEGRMEGPRKLAAFKALNQESALQARTQLKEQLGVFFSQRLATEKPGSPLLRRAQRMLNRLSSPATGSG